MYIAHAGFMLSLLTLVCVVIMTIIIIVNGKGGNSCENQWAVICVATGEVHQGAPHGSRYVSSSLAQYDVSSFYYFFYHHHGHLSSSLSD